MMSTPTSQPSWLNSFLSVAITLAVAAIGAGLAYLADVPAPFLVGSSLAVTFLGLAGFAIGVPVNLRNICFVIIGLTMGAGVTPQVLESAKQWPLSFVILALSLVVIMVGCRWLLQSRWHFDPMTALLSVVPGHLSYVLGLSSQTGCDMTSIGIIQSLRLLALTILVPFAVVLIGFETAGFEGNVSVMTLTMLLLSIAMSFGIGFGFNRFRLPAAYLLGGLLWSTVSHITGFIDGTVSSYVATPAFIILGALIGTRFSGVTLAQLKRAFAAGFVVTVIAFSVSALAAWLVSFFIDAPLSHLLIAFAPGGVETMAAMAVSLDADPAFVAAHHVMRLFILTFLAPLMLSMAQRSANQLERP